MIFQKHKFGLPKLIFDHFVNKQTPLNFGKSHKQIAHSSKVFVCSRNCVHIFDDPSSSKAGTDGGKGFGVSIWMDRCNGETCGKSCKGLYRVGV